MFAVVLLAAFACGGRSSALHPTSVGRTSFTSQAPLPTTLDNAGAPIGTLAGAGDIAVCAGMVPFVIS